MLMNMPHNPFLLLHGLAMLALVTMSYGLVVRKIAPVLSKGLAVGVAFGLGTGVAMADPFMLLPGINLDNRGVLVALAGPFGGPLAALASAAVAMGFRLWMGGPEAIVGCLGIGFAASAGVVFVRFFPRRHGGYRLGPLAILATAGSLNGLSILLMPSVDYPSLWNGWLLWVLASNWVGIVLFGQFLSAEGARIHATRLLEREATIDPLTHLPNRRKFDASTAPIFQQSRRTGRPVALLMIDVDRFKQVNDTWGHDVGDRMLREVAEKVEDSVRRHDIVARYGGEEIVVMMPAADRREAAVIAERIRARVDEEVFHRSRATGNVTVSIGAAVADGRTAEFGPLFKAADEALYRAKREGNNRVVVAEDAPPPPASEAEVGLAA